jgi:hypothetical protein
MQVFTRGFLQNFLARKSMGICASVGEDDIRDRSLQRKLVIDKESQDQIHKLLLLGAGESGKSTLFKQMISIYGKGFSEAER